MMLDIRARTFTFGKKQGEKERREKKEGEVRDK